jgi:uncharacterized phage-like protein YoqJ
VGGYNNKTNRCKPIKQALKELFQELFKDPEHDFLFTGMALGVDQWAAEVALEMGVKVIAVIPCKDQECVWPQSAQLQYTNILSKCYKTILVDPRPYAKELNQMQKRNLVLIDACDVLVAVWSGSRYSYNNVGQSTGSGTYNCVEAATEKGKPIYQIFPGDLRRIKLSGWDNV